MNQSKKIHTMVISALLIAVGVAIPMFMPIKLVIPPASYTLASHVAIIIAMFVSPFVGVAVALGTTLGFLLGGFPISVVLRAFSHVVWAGFGALYLKKNPNTLCDIKKAVVFNLATALLHGICEVAIITPMYFANSLPAGNYANGYMYSILMLVGIGTVIHHSVDFVLSVGVWKVLVKNKSISSIANVKEITMTLEHKEMAKKNA